MGDLDIVDWTDRLHDDCHDNREKFLILHHTVTDSAETTLNVFNERKVSSHYIVDIDGKIYQTVHDAQRAWHAGLSDWENRINLNDSSIGIEIVNMGDKPFPPEQVSAVANLANDIIHKYDIKVNNITGHADIAPGRKFDPSGYFDWEAFYKELDLFQGLYDSHLTPEQQRAIIFSGGTRGDYSVKDMQSGLRKFGYKIEINDQYDQQTKNVVEAFNRHFCPEIFEKEKIINQKVIQNPSNQRWYGLSKERLDFLACHI